MDCKKNRESIVLIGVGNTLFLDEGVGCYSATYLEKNYDFSPQIEIIDGATLGFKLMNYYLEYDRVIILDTISIDDESGSIYVLPSDELMGLGSYRQSAHEVEVVEMLEICSLLGKMAQVSVVGIIPDDIKSVKIDLSPKIKSRFLEYIELIIKELQTHGVSVSAKSQMVSLDDVIKSYNTLSHTL